LLYFGPPNGPTVGRENNLPEDTTRGVGGKNLRALVANDPALTFFLKKVQFPDYWYLISVKVLNK